MTRRCIECEAVDEGAVREALSVRVSGGIESGVAARLRRDARSALEQHRAAVPCGAAPMLLVGVLGRVVRLNGEWIALLRLRVRHARAAAHAVRRRALLPALRPEDGLQRGGARRGGRGARGDGRARAQAVPLLRQGRPRKVGRALEDAARAARRRRRQRRAARAAAAHPLLPAALAAVDCKRAAGSRRGGARAHWHERQAVLGRGRGRRQAMPRLKLKRGQTEGEKQANKSGGRVSDGCVLSALHIPRAWRPTSEKGEGV